MTDETAAAPPGDSADPPRKEWSRRSALLGLAAIGGAGTAGIGGLAYAGGRFPADRLTPARFADRFEQVYGKHAGFRRNHAKGVSAAGYFTADGAGTEVSRATVFAPGRTPVTGRFSLSGGLPDAPDTAPTVRGLGLLFHLPDGEQWRTAMINLPVFLDRTPQGFYARMLAARPLPATGKPDPEKMAAFLAEYPETAKAMAVVKRHPPTSGFHDSTYNALNAFRCTNEAGDTVPVRWSLKPAGPVGAGSTTAPPGRDHLFDALIAKVAREPLRWRLVLTVGRPGDPTDDATLPWPGDRRTIDAGTLTIDSVQTEAAGNARDVNFDPLILPDGIAASDDPLLSARSAVYSQSFTRRAGEPKTPSPVDVTKERR
ncbi:catalase family peroxidase [Streptomyces ochraceiscleroticus]|uniref:Catalase-related peroxidase n=1 Tax=Streptomyces ochraceiscleroticus TaxID=47761 RepID=A0ABW1MJ38_9ACTN|nr:catalase family peroxidase [Streptomyces ochraceiscleroticus]